MIPRDHENEDSKSSRFYRDFTTMFGGKMMEKPQKTLENPRKTPPHQQIPRDIPRDIPRRSACGRTLRQLELRLRRQRGQRRTVRAELLRELLELMLRQLELQGTLAGTHQQQGGRLRDAVTSSNGQLYG